MRRKPQTKTGREGEDGNFVEKVNKKANRDRTTEEDESEKIKTIRVSKKDVAGVNKKDGEDEMILTDLEDYIKTASYLGTKVITPTMRKYVYRRRLDGLAILNTNIIDKKLKEAIDYLVKFKPEEWAIVCKREAGWRPVKMFSELTGVRVFTKKYPAGILTNTQLPDFFEVKMMMICDPWIDKNALNDSKKVRMPVVGICDTNNHTMGINQLIIGNNKSNKPLGLFFWLIAREYMKAHKIDKKLPSLEDFVGEELVLEEPRKKKKEKLKEEQGRTEEQMIEAKMREIGKAEEGV